MYASPVRSTLMDPQVSWVNVSFNVTVPRDVLFADGDVSIYMVRLWASLYLYVFEENSSASASISFT